MLPALVLTAGLGTRLDPITRLIAKPAVPIGDRTLIEHVLTWLQAQGVSELVLNLHHRPSTITSVVGDGAHLGMSVRYSWEQPVLGSAGGPRRAAPLVASDTFLIVNGDTLCDLDLATIIDAHRQSNADVTLAVVPNDEPDRYNGLTVGDDDVVTGIVPRGQAEGSWHFVGVQVVQSKVFDVLADGVPAETVSGLYRDMIAHEPGRVRAWRASATFLDVGTPRDYLTTALRYGGATNAPTAQTTRSIVWPNVICGPDVTFDDCVVAGPLRIPAGFRARSSVIVPASVVRSGDAADIRGSLAVFPIG